MNIFDLIKKFIKYLIPPSCAGCNEIGVNLCNQCKNQISFVEYQVCPNCRTRSFFGNFCSNKCLNKFLSGKECFLDGIVVCCNYERNGIIEKLITKLKYKYSDEIKDILSPIIEDNFNRLKDLNIDFILPVPLHSKREQMRGFNQSEVICDSIKKTDAVKIIKILKRKYNTLQQAKLSRSGRLVNLTDAFELIEINTSDTKKFNGKNFLIIDDVCTTGSTLNECAKALKKINPNKIYGLVLARG